MRVFMATPHYVQGPGALGRLGALVAALARRPFVLVDDGIAGLVWPRISKDLAAHGLDARRLNFGGEVTEAALDDIAVQSLAHAGDLVVGVGGGKALDAAKGLAQQLRLDVVTVPTIASTDAPASRGFVVYDPSHRLLAVRQLPRNPLCVLVDTDWIAHAPVRFLRAGIGDAISKKFEVEACAAAGGLNKHGERACGTALAVADACYTTLRAHGPAAVEAVSRASTNEALEAVVEACILMGALAFENGGLSLAHAMTPGLATARGASARLHGEHVAYGLLLQLALEGRADVALRDIATFYRTVGLPDSLAAMGMAEPALHELGEIAAANVASTRPRNTLVEVTHATVLAALQRVERLAVQ